VNSIEFILNAATLLIVVVFIAGLLGLLVGWLF
jgi:hypothetical protein